MSYERWNANVLLLVGFVLGGITTSTVLVPLYAVPVTFDFGNLAEWATGLFTAGLIGLGIWQLKRQTFHQRQWSTIQTCDRYDNDPILADAKRLLRTLRSQKAGAYTRDEVRSACRSLFNYFDSIAIGLHQHLYVGEIVDEHLMAIMYDWYEFLGQEANATVVEFQNRFLTDYASCSRLIDDWVKGRRQSPTSRV